MRVLIQRVASASVEIDGEVISQIKQGLLVFYCAMKDDSVQQIPPMARKITHLRLFSDSDGKMNNSLLDVAGSCLVVSQFTLAADLSRGHRPSFSNAAPIKLAECLYNTLIDELRSYCPVEAGRFAADMQVKINNDGPATLWLDFQ